MGGGEREQWRRTYLGDSESHSLDGINLLVVSEAHVVEHNVSIHVVSDDRQLLSVLTIDNVLLLVEEFNELQASATSAPSLLDHQTRDNSSAQLTCSVSTN